MATTSTDRLAGSPSSGSTARFSVPAGSGGWGDAWGSSWGSSWGSVGGTVVSALTDRFGGVVAASVTQRLSGSPGSAATDRWWWLEALSGDATDGDDVLLLSGDESDGNDGVVLSGNFAATVHLTDRL